VREEAIDRRWIKAEYFSKRDWTDQIKLKRLPKFKFARMRFAKLQAGQAKRRAGEWSLDLPGGQIKSGSAPPASRTGRSVGMVKPSPMRFGVLEHDRF